MASGLLYCPGYRGGLHTQFSYLVQLFASGVMKVPNEALHLD
jgi:hypothetical protein